MAKLNLTPEVKQFFAFIDSTESRNTDLIPYKNCMASTRNRGYELARIKRQAEKDMAVSR